jgi:hypothetical protein
VFAGKVVDAVRDYVGIRDEPARIRRKALAEADAAVILAEGEVRAHQVRERALARLEFRELRRQANIESIVRGAIEAPPPSGTPGATVDPDWIAEFFKQCEDVGDADMQTLWSKLLAGEVAQPGRFSRRTLQTVRLFSKEDAHLFTAFASYLWVEDRDALYFRLPAIDKHLEKRDVRFGALMHLRAIGLLDFENDLVRTVPANERLPFRCAERAYRIWSENMQREIPIAALTAVAYELLPVSGAIPDPDFPGVASAALSAMGLMLLDGSDGTIGVPHAETPPSQPEEP